MDGLEELTDKEKETLRLIVRGHDAKSMANELSLSVHTINERLREARRKLGVTSSREAGRLLLESEGGDHQNLGDKDFGEVGSTESGEVGRVAAGKPARRILPGVLVMMTMFAAGLILTSYLAEPAQNAAPVEVSASDAAVVAAARDWLALTDASDWEASFDATGKTFREANTLAGWTNAAKQVRGSQGAFVSRELLTVRYLNAPPHGYEEVTFATRYENSKVIETVTLQEEDGAWKVVGILVD
ncbi:helix-turn-helix domain-containing protein [Qipengyuania soli]|uniref:DUF4019 domain-containing protein n=1 Tax=Qipengyuania soli TaxID=2782568 RepID=A0A7S8F499_9SPHN|nr:DUF4019 domain-containing protein [Qipengyuania soli]QPC98830.1 DUF4019 domain-containing protein [Qipengyuania soli]